MTTTRTFLTILFLFLYVEQTTAEAELRKSTKERPIIGLVLSGGGARGASHIGVLKVLEELRIPIDIVTGTSMGAIVGGLYAYGYSAEKIEELIGDTDWDAMFRDEPPRKERSFRRKLDDYNFLIKPEAGLKDGRIVIPKGLLQGQQLMLRLKSLTLSAPRDFDAFPIRFRAIAADIENGDSVVLGNGSLADAMRASLSIPGVFAPFEWNGRLLVDGGFVNNLPVQLARDLGADVVIAVDLSGEPRGRNELSSPFSIMNQILGLTIQRNTAEQLKTLGPDDVLIQPELRGYSSTDFWRSPEMIDRGVLAAKLNSQRLKRISVSESVYRDYLTSVRQRLETAPRIDNIVVDNQSPLSSDVVKSYITVKPGDKLDVSTLDRDMQQLYGLKIFERVDYDLLQEEEEAELAVEVKEKDWGPHYLRFGLNMESDFEGSGIFNFATSYTMTPINSLAGEWRTELQVGRDMRLSTELYQPIDRRLRYYLRSLVGYSKTHIGQFESGKQVADLEVSFSRFELAAGRQFGNWGQLEIGARTGSGDLSPRIGDLSTPTQDFNTGAWFVNFGYDRLDSINFPKSGSLAFVSWSASREALGADVEQDALAVHALWAGTWNKHTLMFWSGIAGVVDSEGPAEGAFSMGGYLNLSGYRRSELAGRYAGLVRLIYLKELGESRSVLKLPIYLGVSLEAGNVWDDKDEIRFDSLIPAGSISLAVDSPLGPIYLARGLAEGGRSATYLFLGRTFSFF